MWCDASPVWASKTTDIRGVTLVAPLRNKLDQKNNASLKIWQSNSVTYVYSSILKLNICFPNQTDKIKKTMFVLIRTCSACFTIIKVELKAVIHTFFFREVRYLENFKFQADFTIILLYKYGLCYMWCNIFKEALFFGQVYCAEEPLASLPGYQ